MLTDSRFRPGHSALKQRLAAENIDAKFAAGKGHKVVTDYRGHRAFSSFEVCPILDGRWLLVAKIDEAEVLTGFYQTYRAAMADRLTNAAAAHPPDFCKTQTFPEEYTVVDMDEFRRTAAGQPLVTFGVSTCTAIVVSLPNRFAYMGHASTEDRIYGDGNLDLLGHMLERIRHFEIRPCQLREVRATIVAPHTRSLPGAVDTLLAKGLYLSQIRFLHNAQAARASVVHHLASGETVAEWKPDGADAGTVWQRASDAPPMEAFLRTSIGWQAEDQPEEPIPTEASAVP